jgi:hypothetical protein
MGSNYHDHDAIAMRWVDRAYHGQQFANARKGANLHDEGDSIYSYGHHFEVARILRDHKRRPVGWLLNGNTYSNTTNKHQFAVRNAIARNGRGLPSVTIPHDALAAAGIELESVQIVNVQPDWWTEREERRFSRPESWVTRETRTEIGGWQNTLTGEYRSRVTYWGPDAVSQPKVECDHVLPDPPGPWKPGFNWYRDAAADHAREIHERARHGVWEEVPSITRSTGRVRIFSSSNVEWDIEDDPESPIGVAYTRIVRRHWLGASLIKAATIHQVNRKHDACNGTGVGEERWVYNGMSGEGPLTEDEMARHLRHEQFVMERNGGIRQPVQHHVETYRREDFCFGCSGRGTIRVPRRRWAYYLSGFDLNETRPSYFFCELPPKSAPTTVAEAYEALKPASVKLAEAMGREVKRQGDIFAIPVPSVDTAQLKRDGEYRRYASEMVTETIWNRRGRPREVRMRRSEHLAHVLDTNHECTEVVTINGQTYGRGTMVHSPGDRLPDHKRLQLGKTWHLLVKNTVPIGA